MTARSNTSHRPPQTKTVEAASRGCMGGTAGQPASQPDVENQAPVPGPRPAAPPRRRDDIDIPLEPRLGLRVGRRRPDNSPAPRFITAPSFAGCFEPGLMPLLSSTLRAYRHSRSQGILPSSMHDQLPVLHQLPESDSRLSQANLGNPNPHPTKAKHQPSPSV